MCLDLETLGLRHRRAYDLRRTMISLARTDRARKDLLELCMHNPHKKQSTIDIYTEFPWDALCAEVAKLRVKRVVLAQVVPLPLAKVAGAPGIEPWDAGSGKSLRDADLVLEVPEIAQESSFRGATPRAG
ncbi:hypothetical protein [Polyangium sp. 15x6]|uniref:hypothetical protein n=1 Tax=Polyangium sp. 15x6 TaxID=3042687 RepID=UPI00249A8C72|nr:hypothetical protein [Polyangium sp. 15x6]MDI3287338.1 hypothetical protein [Polyangium sp. 15x6]